MGVFKKTNKSHEIRFIRGHVIQFASELLPPRILVASSCGEQKKLERRVGPLPFLSELNDLARWLCMIINLRGAGAHTA